MVDVKETMESEEQKRVISDDVPLIHRMRVNGRKMGRVMKEQTMWYFLRMRNPIMHLGDLKYHYVISIIFMFTQNSSMMGLGALKEWCYWYPFRTLTTIVQFFFNTFASRK